MYNYGYHYSFGNGTMNAEQVAALVVGILAIVFVIAGIIGIVFYIFKAIGIYKLAKNRGMKNPGLAFVPIINQYTLGSIADNINLTRGKKTGFRISMLILSIVGGIFGFIIAIATISMTIAMIPLIAEYGSDLPSRYAGTMVLLTGFSSLISLVALAEKVVSYFALYRVFAEYTNKNAVMFLVLSILFNISPFFLFAIRNNSPCPAAPKQQYYTVPGQNNPYGYNTPAQNNNPYGYNTPAQNNNPYGYNTPAHNNNPYGYNTPAQNNNPYGYNTPVQNGNARCGENQPLEAQKNPCSSQDTAGQLKNDGKESNN